ncbi:MAG: hypothetical protein C0618_01895 [Desulfuromonas sp.]|nr:MAG: hypothetical protein C0618_01895 [Desulfuromonas sp.]
MPQKPRIKLAVCRNFIPEVTACLQQLKLNNIQVLPWEPCCEHPPKSWQSAAELIETDSSAPVMMIGGCLPTGLTEPPEGYKHLSLFPLENCFHLLSGRTQVNTFANNGNYLVSSGSILTWRNRLHHWGFNQETARLFFRDTTQKIVLLETNIDCESSQAHLKEFSDYVDRPVSIEKIGLDYLSFYLRSMIESKTNQILSTRMKMLQEQTANQMMALDLFDALIDKPTEAEAIEGVCELFRTLFAPRDVRFSHHWATGQDTSYDGKPCSFADRLRLSRGEKFVVHKGRQGFSLTLQSQSLNIGHIDIVQVSFPEHLNRYLNLALSLIPLCTLGIHKGRMSEDLKREMDSLVKMTRELGESEKRFQLAFMTNPDPTVLIRLEDGALLHANRAFTESIGVTPAGLNGLEFATLNFWMQPEEPGNILNLLRSAEDIDRMEVSTRNCSGEPIDYQLSARQLSLKNEPCGLIFMHNITAEKTAEQILRDSNRVKNEFISMAAHELRTPLSTMMGFTEFLMEPENYGGFTEEQKQEFLADIYSRGESLNRIVDDLLDVSRIESGRPLTLDFQTHDLKKMVEKTVADYQVHNSGHRFETRIQDPNSPAPLSFDLYRTKQVIENLLNNAQKYSPENRHIIVSVHQAQHAWEIQVSDQGFGMTPDQVQRIFDKFYRVDSSNTAIQGLGLGMSIVKQIVEAHGGEIDIDSTKGVGTKVTVRYPLTGTKKD